MAKVLMMLGLFCCLAMNVPTVNADTSPQAPKLQTIPSKKLKMIERNTIAEKYVPVKEIGSNSIKFIPQNQVKSSDKVVPLMLPGYASASEEYVERISSLEEDVSDLKDIVKNQTMLIELLNEKLDSFTSSQEESEN